MMNEKDIAETAYKNGFNEGFRQGIMQPIKTLHGELTKKEGRLVYCSECKYQYDCERTYLGACTDGKEWGDKDEL